MHVLKRNAIGHLASVMWENARGHRVQVALYAVMAGAAVLVGLAGPLVMARLMRAVQYQSGGELIASAKVYLALSVLLGVAFWLFHGPSRVMETTIAFVVKRALQMALFRKVTSLPMSWHRAHHSGETIDQVAKAATALGDFTESGFEVIHLLTRFVGSVALLAWLMPAAGAAVTIVGALAVLVIVLFDRRLVQQYRALNKRFNEVAASVQDYLTNVATVISLRLEQRVERELQERTDRILPLWRKNSITNEFKWFTTSRFVDVTHAGVLFAFIAIMVKSGKPIELGTMYALSEYLRSIGDSFFQFTGKYGDLVMKSTRVHAVDHIDEAFEREAKASARAGLPAAWKRVEIRNLTFVHEGAENGDRVAGVHGVDFDLVRGRSYALVGESGSGKSTVLKLIRGLHLPQHAEVVCDGVRMEYGIRHVAHHSTLIPQDPEIFANTIRFNVTMGVAADEAEVRQALRLARFEQVLARLPRGLDTNIAEKGVSLSGGEKQRLALARGLFFVRESGSDIVLLDEPTSSVDIFNEKLIYEGVLREFCGYSLVTAIHKFSLLHLFDEVLVFAEGRLVERGDTDYLLTLGGEFRRLWDTFSGENDLAKVIG